MAARDTRPGALEIRFSFTEVNDGAVTEAYSTPSMWALADEWSDALQARSYDEKTGRFEHTDEWVRVKMLDAIALQAAQEAGLLRPGAISLDRIAVMKNLYTVDVLPDEQPPEPQGDEAPLAGDGEA